MHALHSNETHSFSKQTVFSCVHAFAHSSLCLDCSLSWHFPITGSSWALKLNLKATFLISFQVPCLTSWSEFTPVCFCSHLFLCNSVDHSMPFKIHLPVSPSCLIDNSLECVCHSILHIVGTLEMRALLKQGNDYDLITVCGCKKPVTWSHLFKKLFIDKAEAISFIDSWASWLLFWDAFTLKLSFKPQSNSLLPVLVGRFLGGLLIYCKLIWVGFSFKNSRGKHDRS